MLKNLVARPPSSVRPPPIPAGSDGQSLPEQPSASPATGQSLYPQVLMGGFVRAPLAFHGTRPLASTTTQATMPSGNNASKLALNDAFSYLDRVKAEFEGQPEVYNRFLQVMRDFKNNAIDATGVIGRVVQLFRGHPDLILGFNTFLPRTHQIDPSMVESHYAATSQSPPPPHPLYAASAKPAYQEQHWTIETGDPTKLAQPLLPTSHPTGSANNSAQPAVNINKRNNTSSMEDAGPDASDSAAPLAGPSNLRGSNAQFTKAISYVKKVKHRFASDSDSYKTFLSALHSFHRDQRSVQDVYLQVNRLFQSHPDLLEEFMQFLPEGGADVKGSLPPIGQFAPSLSGGRRASQQSSGAAQRSKRSRTEPAPIIIPSIDKTKDEVDFFERCKNYIGNHQNYAEFLKCLNLYSQDILRQDELIKLVSNFIGGDLLSWFKRYIGYKSKRQLVDADEERMEEEATDSEAEPRPKFQQRRRYREVEEQLPTVGPHDIPELNLADCRRVHASYRLLPANYKLPSATGRDDIGREALNDSLLCCASFEREDSTFVSSRKNAYEEALFRCEDERFELDLLIEGNRATLAVLEPINKRLEAMDKAEQDSFRLDTRLNGHSAMIYRRNLHRIYGDKAEAILEALQKRPSISISVVLRRLRQKDEEWRQTLREWNAVWRTVHLKNYYKALDHQGIDFKANDRRNLSLKTVVADVNTALLQSASREACYELADSGVQADAFALLEYALRYSGAVPASDRKAVLEVLEQLQAIFTSGHSQIIYCNTVLMGAMRLVQMAMERLSGAKAVALSQDPLSHARKVSVVATFLELPQTEEESPSSNVNSLMQAEGDSLSLYNSLLELTKALLAGQADLAVYEERVRFMFGTAAYPMYTFDRLSSVLLRAIHQSVLGDSICEGLLRLHSSWSHPGLVVPESSHGDTLISVHGASTASGLRLSEWTARLAAENIIGASGGSLIRVCLLEHPQRQMRAQAFNGSASPLLPRAEESWSAYVDDFVTRIDANPRYLDPERYGPVFLGRCLRRCLDPSMGERLAILYRLECKICLNTFRLLFVAGTEDYMFKKPRRTLTRCSSTSSMQIA
jgi:hypothetical protein